MEQTFKDLCLLDYVKNIEDYDREIEIYNGLKNVEFKEVGTQRTYTPNVTYFNDRCINEWLNYEF
jgi:hypothetical protein